MNRQSWQRWLLLLFSGLFGALLIGESIISSAVGSVSPFLVFSSTATVDLSLPGWSGAAAGLKS
jgi:hypothetical protein